MKFTSILLLTFISFGTFAKDIQITCNFTEPFINIKITTDVDNAGNAGDKVSYFDYSYSKAKIATTINNSIITNDFQMAFVFSGVDVEKQTLLVDLSKSGSDGMSDKVYDAEAVLSQEGRRDFIGGCDFN